MTQPVQHFAIQADLAQAVIDFLITQPYRDVAQLIEGLRSMPMVVQDKSPDDGGGQPAGGDAEEAA